VTPSVDRTERLLNLVIGLLGASLAVSRATIRESIPGYGSAPTDAAFERMFERDKEELRSMGIPVETVHDTSGEVLGYRIPREAYALAPVEFTVEERAAIAVAAQVWSRAPIAPVPGTALRKLEAVGDVDWVPADVRGAIELTAADAALLPLMQALREDRVVHFDYRTPTADEASRRTVSPWGVMSSSGRWFLIGYDHDREGERTFRLSRMAGALQVTAQARHQPPEDFDVSAARLVAAAEETVTVRFRVAPRRGASLRRRAIPQDGIDPFEASEITVELGSAEEAVSLACAAGADVVVLEPASVRTATADALATIRRAHDGSPA
jgi:proteasome accessory factor B